MARFKIDAIRTYHYRERSDRPFGVTLFRRRWWGWSRIASFVDTAEALAHYRTIDDLPQYMR